VTTSILVRFPIFRAALVAGLTTACGESCPVAEDWDAPDWDTNAAESLALRGQLDTLGTALRETEQGTRTLDAAALTAAWEAGSPSLLDVTSPGYQPIVDDALAEFGELAAVGPTDLVDDTGAWTPGAAGGTFGSSTRGINEGGIEVRQMIDKGVFGGAGLYNYAAGLTAGDVHAETVEAIAAAFGAESGLSAEEEITDSANYANSMGYFDDVAVQLTIAHGHAENHDCEADRDAALVAAFRTWELAMYARFVFYANEALAAVTAEVTDESVATAIHELSEGLGLAAGFYGLTAPASGPLAAAPRVVTDAAIERMMTAMGVDLDDLGASSTGELIVDPTALETGVREVEAAVAEAFGLTQAEVEAFRVETASE
jgi:hypothetical protein